MSTILLRYKFDNKVTYGILDRDKIYEIKGSIYGNYEISSESISLSDIVIMPPVLPTKIIALGYNYKDLVGQQDKYEEPVIFLKPPSSVITHNDVIKIPFENKKVWIEVELSIIIKKTCKNVTVNNAKDYILGYTIGNDITVENINTRDHHLARSKAWDTFCPIGPYIVLDIDTSDLKMKTSINGKIFQNSTTKNRILNDYQTLSLISRFMTLNKGDVILTGTPANAENSVIMNGDSVKLEIENIGILENKVSLLDGK